MELQQELEQYKNALEQVNAEKISLDQLFVESLKAHLTSKKELILLQNSNQKLLTELNELKQELVKFKSEVPSASVAA